MRNVLCAVFVLACTSLVPVQAQEFESSRTTVVIPFAIGSNFLIIVEAQAGNVGGLKFIVDTGATHSVIDTKIASRLELPHNTGKTMNFDHSIPVEWAELPELQVGPLRAKGVRVMVVDLPRYSEVADGVDGIVGLDLLSKSDKFTIDYSKKVIYFDLAANGSARPVPGCFVVPVVVQGLVIRLAVDTGASGIILYGDRIRKHLLKMRTEGEPKPATMGRIAGTLVTLPGVKLGASEKTVTVMLIKAPEEAIMPGLDGYLGVAALHAKRIEFDFAKMLLRWQ